MNLQYDNKFWYFGFPKLHTDKNTNKTKKSSGGTGLRYQIWECQGVKVKGKILLFFQRAFWKSQKWNFLSLVFGTHVKIFLMLQFRKYSQITISIANNITF